MANPEFIVGMETSGAIRDAIIALGYPAISVDLLPAQNGGPHHQGCVFDFIDANPGRFAGGFFHPDCTFLTVSAAWAFKDPDFGRWPGVGYHQRVQLGTKTGAARREARTRAIADVERVRRLPFLKGMENPRGVIPTMTSLKRETQTVHPFQFGSDASKQTCLWWFGEEGERRDDIILPIRPELYVKPRLWCRACRQCSTYDGVIRAKGCEHCGGEQGQMLPRWANQSDGGQNRETPGADRWQVRSNTYPGIAEAIAKALVRAAT